MRVFPFLSWFGMSSKETLRADFIGGLTVALVLIPQSMAYAQLAGLPAYYGLYAAFLPPMIASLFGSSRQLATGPVAVVSLMTSAALEPLASAGSQEYIAYAILLALLVGIFQFLLGVLKLGLIVNFLSHPVVNGFTNAAALIIASSQLSKIFGVDVDKASHHYETIYRVVVEAFHFTHWPTLGMAVLSFAIMIVLKRVNPKIPNVLVAVAVTTLLSWAVGFQENASVTISDLRSPEVQKLIRNYNAAVHERKEMESFRAAMNKAMEEVMVPGQRVCISCHSVRDIELFKNQKLAEGLPMSGRALLLHHGTGLVGVRIDELKHEEEGFHTKLRDLQFEKVSLAEGRAAFYPRGQVPDGLSGDDGRWRIKVRNNPLNEEAILLRGGGAVVGVIPEGLPKIALPVVDLSIVLKLFVVAMIISLLGFMEAISIAKAMAARTHQKLDPNQELIGQGLANIVGCMGQSYAVSGSFSRSAVNLQAGAITGLSNVISSAVVVITLLFFTPMLYHLPQAVLASIIMMAVVGLLNVTGFIHAWEAKRFDGITAVTSFLGTLILAPHLEWGIAIGVCLSLGAYLYRTTRPHVAELSLHRDGSLRDARRYGLQQCKHIAAIRYEGPLNFANTSHLEEEILSRVADAPELRHVLIVGHSITELDASGEEMLDKILERLRASGYQVSFSGLNDNVLDVMRRTHLIEKIGEENLYSTALTAIEEVHAAAHAGSDETRCPLLKEHAFAVLPTDLSAGEPGGSGD